MQAYAEPRLTDQEGRALWLAWFGSSWPVVGAACAALALLLAQFAFVGHDAGHGSISRGACVNRAFGQLAMTLVTGLAFDEWIARHRIAYHGVGWRSALRSIAAHLRSVARAA
jgi:hypothetical protein